MAYKRCEYKQADAIEIIVGLDSADCVIGDLLLDILRYAGIMCERTTAEHSENGFRCFLLHRPKTSSNRAIWTKQNCQRIRSFAIEANPVKFV